MCGNNHWIWCNNPHPAITISLCSYLTTDIFLVQLITTEKSAKLHPITIIYYHNTTDHMHVHTPHTRTHHTHTHTHHTPHTLCTHFQGTLFTTVEPEASINELCHIKDSGECCLLHQPNQPLPAYLCCQG